MLSVGTTIGNFEITGTLGAGGFGVTYKALDVLLGNHVAIKEYFPEQFAHREGEFVLPISGAEEEFDLGLRDFLDEARRLARFKHPNIVGVSSYIEGNNTAYIVMNYLPGRTLFEWLSEIDGDPPTQEELDLLCAPLLDALELIHRHEMLHRDIKLSNIIITDDGQPILIDFGAAREASSLRSREIGSFLSPPYSPFEQYSTDITRQGPWSDIYSLAVTIYRCMTGEFPPDAPQRVQEGGELQMPSAMKKYRPQFIIGLEAALHVDRRKRPKNVAEWREMLFSRTTLEWFENFDEHQGLGWIFRYVKKALSH